MPQSRFLLWPLWIFAAVCCSAPFLVAPHTYPIPTFYAESASAWCWIAFALVVLGLSWRGRAGLPSIALAPLSLILVLIVQLGIATPLNPFFSFAACICLLAAMVVCGLGARCREMPGVLEAVAVGTILGGLATVAVEQVHLWRLVGIPDILIGLPPTGLGRRMWGNLN